MIRVFGATICIMILLTSSLAYASEPAVTLTSQPAVFHALAGSAPERGKATAVAVHESDQMVARVLRLAPDATIEEHYHPFFDETFFVHSGAVRMMLNDREHVLRAGDVVYMPGGTIISGRNTEPDEAVVVVVWANLGKKGPLFVYGRPDAPTATERR